MLKHFYHWTSVITRLQQGPLGPYLEDLALTLHQQGYAPSTIREYVYAYETFGRWLSQKGYTVANTDEPTITLYLHGLRRSPAGKLPKAGRGLTHLRRLMQQRGIVPACPLTTPLTAADAWLRRYEQYLPQVLGAAPSTRQCYLRIAQRFLATYSMAGPLDWSALQAQHVASFVRQEAATKQRFGRRVPAVAMRAFLRFLTFSGAIPRGLEAAVPMPRSWKHAALPPRLTTEEVARVLAACREETPQDVRDRAILFLLAHLGLRAQEITTLCLEAIDWRRGHLVIRSGKTHAERVLPLSQEVGSALVTYLTQGRPASTSRAVFLHYRPPFRPFAGASAITQIARRALLRAGVTVRPRMGAHTFRHTIASQMVNQGASFKEVADILGHRSLQTTGIYAKLDLEALTQIALPWVGGTL